MLQAAHDMSFMKETLHAQQELLQKLYDELDEERESSSVAADEALSMILRLQGEKAAMEMEASQYKRIAEEKMCHAQETAELFQELIYQKEMLIASLEFHVQAYRFKLESMGVDLDICEMQYPENMLSRMNGFSGETSGQSSWKRGNSLPPLVLDAISRRGPTEGSKSLQSSPRVVRDFKEEESSSRNGAQSSYLDEMRKLEERVRELTNKNVNDILTPVTPRPFSESSSAIGQGMKRGSSLPPLVLDAICKRGSAEGSKSSQSSPKAGKDFKEGEASLRRDHNSYWDEMRKIEDRVREFGYFRNNNEILTPTNAKGISYSSSANFSMTTLPICNPSPDTSPKKPDCAGEPTSADPQCSPNVHDVFEVPLCPDPSLDDSYHNNEYKSPVVDESNAKKTDSVWGEILKSDKQNIDWEKKPVLSPVNVNDTPKPRDTNDKIDGKKPPLLPPSKSNDQLKSKDTKSNEKISLFKYPSCGADFDLQLFNRRLKQIEDGRFTRRGRDINAESTSEEIKLLKEILDKVDKVQSELTTWRPDKPPPKESVGCIKQAVLCFLP